MVSGDQPRAVPSRSPGRPRLYEPDAERDRILTAAIEVLRRNAGEEATVADILQEAGLSTRAFYRHFETKEDVVRAIYQRDAESFADHVRRAVEAAADPPSGLIAWVNELLGLAYDRRRAERVSALSSPMVFRVVGGTETRARSDEPYMEPLRMVLEKGVASGDFPDARPELDVRTIHAITWEAVNWARSGTIKLSRSEACDYVVHFCWTALGAQA
jgi:AcrR family transcriptional regulator